MLNTVCVSLTLKKVKKKSRIKKMDRRKKNSENTHFLSLGSCAGIKKKGPER